jgi:hypothetical protein
MSRISQTSELKLCCYGKIALKASTLKIFFHYFLLMFIYILTAAFLFRIFQNILVVVFLLSNDGTSSVAKQLSCQTIFNHCCGWLQEGVTRARGSQFLPKR